MADPDDDDEDEQAPNAPKGVTKKEIAANEARRPANYDESQNSPLSAFQALQKAQRKGIYANSRKKMSQ